jgi:hypothetical protein
VESLTKFITYHIVLSIQLSLNLLKQSKNLNMTKHIRFRTIKCNFKILSVKANKLGANIPK